MYYDTRIGSYIHVGNHDNVLIKLRVVAHPHFQESRDSTIDFSQQLPLNIKDVLTKKTSKHEAG